jgi:hypothetical protein
MRLRLVLHLILFAATAIVGLELLVERASEPMPIPPAHTVIWITAVTPSDLNTIEKGEYAGMQLQGNAPWTCPPTAEPRCQTIRKGDVIQISHIDSPQ